MKTFLKFVTVVCGFFLALKLTQILIDVLYGQVGKKYIVSEETME